LHGLAEALLEHEILDGEQINLILKGQKLEAKKRSDNNQYFRYRHNPAG